MRKRTLTFITDPGHGWLSVSIADLNRLGIAGEISTCSYMNGKRAYLEEDGDASIFMNAAKAAGWDITIKESNNATSDAACRNYPNYDPYFAENPFGEGSRFSHRGRNGTRKGRYLKMDDGGVFTFRKSNPLVGLAAPV
jgi:hypothetical protein